MSGEDSDGGPGRYDWQLGVPEFGAEGQARLKNARVLVTRVGGVGSAVSYYLAAAGVGTLVLAHGGVLHASDLNRQILMTHAALGTPRVDCAARRLNELNPELNVVTVAENASPENAERLVAGVDLVVDCAPLFQERLALNDAAVRQRKPLVECAMYELEAQVSVVRPGETACLRCLYPQPPAPWKRRFPVFGAVAGVAGSVGAMEVLKLLAGFGETLSGRMLSINLRTLEFRTLKLKRNPACPVCSGL